VLGGKLGPAIHKRSEVALSVHQIQRLLNGRRRANNRDIAYCWSPHHGFVFYDAGGKAVAWIEVCFRCHTTKESPPYWPGFDLKVLRRLCQELKLAELSKET
jgi:hypothetical protein